MKNKKKFRTNFSHKKEHLFDLEDRRIPGEITVLKKGNTKYTPIELFFSREKQGKQYMRKEIDW